MKEYIAAAMRVVREVVGGEVLAEEEPRRGEVSPGECDDAGVILCTPQITLLRRRWRRWYNHSLTPKRVLDLCFESISHLLIVVSSVRRGIHRCRFRTKSSFPPCEETVLL